MIDFHSHILPYVDDGSRNFDMSIDMLRISQAEGVKFICATSHYIPGELEITIKDYSLKLNNLRHLCKLKDIEIQIVPALEVYMSLELPKLYREKKIWGYNDSKYVLIEFPMQQMPMYAEEVFYELRLQGVVPVIAHPERNFPIMKDENILVEFLKQGCLAQINAGSIRGIYGKDVKDFAEHLINRNMVHLLGSDAHNDKGRNTAIEEAAGIIKKLNPELSEWMAEAQYKIIDDKNVEPLDVKPEKKRFDFRKLFK